MVVMYVRTDDRQQFLSGGLKRRTSAPDVQLTRPQGKTTLVFRDDVHMHAIRRQHARDGVTRCEHRTLPVTAPDYHRLLVAHGLVEKRAECTRFSEVYRVEQWCARW